MRCSITLIATLMAVPAFAEPAQWQGQSVALRVVERGLICEAGAFTLTLDGDGLRAKLGNATELAGTVKTDGSVEMSGQKGAYIYSFNGKRDGDSMRGSWIDAGSGCGGTWRATTAKDSQ